MLPRVWPLRRRSWEHGSLGLKMARGLRVKRKAQQGPFTPSLSASPPNPPLPQPHGTSQLSHSPAPGLATGLWFLSLLNKFHRQETPTQNMKQSRVTPTTYFIVFYLHKQTSGFAKQELSKSKQTKL